MFGCVQEVDLKKKVTSVTDIGRMVREKRKADGLTIAKAAALCNVGYRFLSNVENGKATAHIGKVLQVLTCLGLELSIESRGWNDD
jgi:y4mF family transcriptional regulator